MTVIYIAVKHKAIKPAAMLNLLNDLREAAKKKFFS